MKSILNRTVTWLPKGTTSRNDLLVIFVFLFLDASIFPLPTTIAFITIALIRPSHSYFLSLMAVVGMVTGALFGYLIGHYLWLLPGGDFTRFAQFFFDYIPGFSVNNYKVAQNIYFRDSYGILFFTVIVPIPYLFFSISAGAVNLNILVLLLSTLIFQGFRFFFLGWLIIKYGEVVKSIFRKNFKMIILILLLLGLMLYLFREFIPGLPFVR